MREVYYAKSADKCGHRITNQEHLNVVAELAQRFGTEVGMPKCAKVAGLVHDFGKYSEAFQNVLNGTATSVDHAICAAAYLYGSEKTAKLAYRMIAEASAAHHSALRSFGSMKAELRDICRGEGSGVCWSGKKSALFGPEQFIEAQSAFSRDFGNFKITVERFDDTSADVKMLRARMLFSCLVDADYTASSGRSADEGAVLDPKALLSKLYAHMEELRKGSDSDKALNRIRNEVFRRCGEAGDMAPGLFTLTAPTGVGKTMSLLHIALRHCIAQGKRRIILVLPFLTLTEQSQREYGKLIDNILSDHSQSRLSEEERELAARWDSPFIITTSVRFFESLFSAHPKDCRKLHSIAQSVILFDEAQSLPSDLATATMRAARSLCDDYGCSIVFSTATQPDFSVLPDLDNWQPREILSAGELYYAALRRTRVCWLLERPTALEDIAIEMAQKDSVCAIVNLRRHAVRLFETLKAACPNDERDSLFFLTTDLCPKHRSGIVDTIKERLPRRGNSVHRGWRGFGFCGHVPRTRADGGHNSGGGTLQPQRFHSRRRTCNGFHA